MRMSTSGAVHTTADAKTTAAALPAAIPEIARELAARIFSPNCELGDERCESALKPWVPCRR